MIDFRKLTATIKPKELNPRDIFMSLPTKAKEYSYLRDVQAEVLKEWFEDRDNKNSIIKMNTGSGKTVVALLILQSSLNEGKGPAVYVVPDSYLVKQVCSEAVNLGISVTEDPEDFGFSSKKSIYVTNIHKLVNGKSMFGMRKDSANKKIGSIVIDDVHACLDIIEQQYTIKLDARTKPYNDVIDILKDPIKKYDKEKYCDLFENPRQYTDMILPFWIWQEKWRDVKRVLTRQEESYDSIEFNMPLIEDVFSTCNCVISLDSIEITPKCTQLSKIRSFESAERRIFLSATLSDDSVFVSTLGLKLSEINKIITPEKANDIGDRLMLFPEYINPKIERDEIRDELIVLSKSHNVVILAPSFNKASYWNDCASQILSTREKNIEGGIEKLKEKNMGITVIVNKYDGIDLPYDACRVLVIDDLPSTRSLYDAALQTMNPDDRWLIRERMQKIEQGIGRGVRSNNDYCVVVFLGKLLSNTIIQNDGIDFFSDATKAQYRLSHNLWGELHKTNTKPTIKDIFDLANYSLNRDIDWISASKEALNDIEYRKKLNIDKKAIAIREAFESSIINEYDKSFNILERIKSETTDDTNKGYLMQLMAEYKNFTNKQEAQELLKSGKRLNRNIIRPIEGIKFSKLINTDPQAIGLLKYLTTFKNDLNDYYSHIRSITGELVFQKQSFKRFEDAIKKIFNAIGYYATRPENDTGSGPDNLVALGNGDYFVIECKNEGESSLISKHDCNQMNGSIQWFDTEYNGDNFQCTPILIHCSSIFNKEASPARKLRIMTPVLLDKFIDSINQFCIALIDHGNPFQLDSISKMLVQYSLTPLGFLDAFTTTFSKAR